MIKLATCFSGIGAIEHALNRMGLDNKIYQTWFGEVKK